MGRNRMQLWLTQLHNGKGQAWAAGDHGTDLKKLLWGAHHTASRPHSVYGRSSFCWYKVSVADASGLRFISSMYSSSMGMHMFVFCKCLSIRRTPNEVGNKQETWYNVCKAGIIPSRIWFLRLPQKARRLIPPEGYHVRRTWYNLFKENSTEPEENLYWERWAKLKL